MADTDGAARARLEPILSPRSVAVVGATRVPGTVPFDIVQNILRDGFQGAVYPVSPSARAICGVKAYKYVLDIPDPVDLAVIVFPSSVVNLAVEQCGRKGVKGLIIISAGFREIGPAGAEREAEIVRLTRKYGMSLIGPNCLGLINTDPAVRLNASFARRMPATGHIGFLSQSGALCTAVLDYAHAKHIGFSKFVSFGNKADLSEIDLMHALANDPSTNLILLYLEELNQGAAFMTAAHHIIRDTSKPVLVLKSGRTRQGASAAASHTGSLAASDEVVDAALRQAGVIRCLTMEDMFSNAIAMTYQPLPAGRRVAIITNAGGPGVLTTDAAVQEGLTLAQFSNTTRDVFRRSLPATANISNPVDIIGDARADRYRVALATALEDANVDGALVILTPQSMTDIDAIAGQVCTVAAAHDKPTYASFMGETDVASGIAILQDHSIPHYTLPEAMCRAFARADEFREAKTRMVTAPRRFGDVNRGAAHEVLDTAITAGRRYLTPSDAMRVLSAYGLPVLTYGVAQSGQEAAAIAARIGCPVAMKVESDDIIHKYDVGAVILDIASPAEASAAYETILATVAARVPEARIDGVCVQQMAGAGEETILGIKRDVAFGPVVMFGLGGLFVEVFKDVAFRIAPIAPEHVQDMMHEVRALSLLIGARGRPQRDITALAVCIQRVSQLAIECPQIQELDINPLTVRDQGNGCVVTDARILLSNTCNPL